MLMTIESKQKHQKLQMEGSNADYTDDKPNNKRWMLLCIISLLCCAGLLLTVIILAIYSAHIKTVQATGSSGVCNTPHCVTTAGKILENIDPNVDPCDNFFEFSCGGFSKRTVIPEDRTTYGVASILSENMQVILKELFERDKSNQDTPVERKVRDFYASCLDVDTIEHRDAKPLLNLLQNFGGWPVLGSKEGGHWNEASYDLEILMGRLESDFNVDSVVSSWVGVDDKNSTRHILEIDQMYPGMGSRDYYLDDQYAHYKRAYLDYMVAITTLLGADETTAMNDMTQVLEFETNLANMTIPSEDRRDNEALYNPTTIGELQQSIPQIDWVKFFDVMMPPETKPLPLTEVVNNRSPIYLANAVRLFVENDPKRVVTNYLLWKLAMWRMSSLSKRFRDAQQDYNRVLYGTTSVSARWRLCVNSVNGNLKFATGKMYVAENFQGDSKTNVEKMISNLKKAFKDMLESNNWMDEKTKVVAREKCDAIREQVGYPDWIMDADAVNEYYDELYVAPNEYFENTVSYLRWSLRRDRIDLRKPVDKDEWFVGPALVNAFYSSSSNLIVFPAGILQPPFYHSESPWYLNYGGIGAVIGHEITHGFDDRGRQYDKDGNLKQWWSDQSIGNFKERAQCIVDQYSGYVMPENNKTLNGRRTQGENIADIGGLKEAFKAYMKENENSDIKLPGFSQYSSEQLFYLNYGQTWCVLYRPESVDRAITSGSHSHPRYRIIGPLHDSFDFAKAFNCPADSYMNPPPEEKCVIW